jgi:UDP-N-acetylglucosamine:LPS N-acetylglucosamine transferase
MKKNIYIIFFQFVMCSFLPAMEPFPFAFPAEADAPSIEINTQSPTITNQFSSLHAESFPTDIPIQTKGSKPVLSKRLANLRTQLATILNDIDRVDVVVKQYRRLLRQVKISKKSRTAIEQWLVDKCVFVGSKQYNHNFIFGRVPELSKNKEFRRVYKEFTSKIKAKAKEVLSSDIDTSGQDNTNQDILDIAATTLPINQEVPGLETIEKDASRKRITILYTGCYGAGHRSPATALANHFDKTGNKVQIIDIDEVQNKYSPRVHGYTRAQIYAEVYQKEGNAKKAHDLSARIEKAHKPENRKFMIDLKKMINDFKSDIIFTVAHHRPNLGYLSYQLNIPMVFVHTDHVFHRSLVPLLKEQMKMKKSLITFSALSGDKNFFKNIFEELGIKNGKLPPAALKQIVRLDFPVRESFQPVSKKEKNEIRDDLHIAHNSIVCKLAMGQNALTKEIKGLLKQLIDQEKRLSRPLHVFTICGKNDMLKKKLEHIVKKSVNPRGKIHVDICGFKEEKEMAQIDKASDVWITKPGGSTSAELVQTKKQMLYVIAPGHPWEKTNARYLEKMQLAEMLSKSKPIIKQIQNRLHAHKQIDPAKIPESRWQKQASRIVWKSVQ